MDADDSMDIRFFLSLALRRKGRSAVDDVDSDFEGFWSNRSDSIPSEIQQHSVVP